MASRSPRYRPRSDLREVAAETPATLEPAPEPAPAPKPSGGGVQVKASGAGPEVKAGPVSAPIIPILLIALGAYLAWFGVHYWRQDLKWPSDPIKAALQGKGLPASSPPPAVSDSLTADVASASGGGAADTGGSAYQGSLPTGSAQNTAKLLLAKFGWAVTEMAPLISLWTRESGWSATARNPSSGAFGIAQALGHGTSCSAAPDGTNEYGPEYGLTCAEAQQANAGSVRWQIEWGLGYIASRYGSPTKALAHENANNWY